MVPKLTDANNKDVEEGWEVMAEIDNTNPNETAVI